jgi:hypothetical protein
LKPDSQRHMDEKAAGLFGAKAPIEAPDYEHIA